jgi:hypothetical protein
LHILSFLWSSLPTLRNAFSMSKWKSFMNSPANVTRQWHIGNLQLATRGKDQRKYSQGICQLIPWCTFPHKKLNSTPLIMSLRMTAVWEAFLHWKLASAGKMESCFPLQFSLPNFRLSVCWTPASKQILCLLKRLLTNDDKMMTLFSWNISNFSLNSIFRYLQRTWIVQINSVLQGPPYTLLHSFKTWDQGHKFAS